MYYITTKKKKQSLNSTKLASGFIYQLFYFLILFLLFSH